MVEETDYAVELNNFLQQHPTGNLTPYFRYAMTQEGKNHNAVHTAKVIFRGATYGEGTGNDKGTAKRAAAKQALEHFKTYGVS
ncbi:hypothetical protein F5148DRAFT_1284403 [Russula earlei]|uniref:Uncharacterized protein n=1 Tax=Russula earlei TaxID=71964 RepID=A0ACC0U9M3_9AGAM|nr:hypothetical protein F5148DRAFT_1284403 [Russula earlei]